MGPGRSQKLRGVLLRPEFRPNYILAARCGMPATRLSEYALGRKFIPPHHLMRLCEVMQVEPEEILGDMENDFVGG